MRYIADAYPIIQDYQYRQKIEVLGSMKRWCIDRLGPNGNGWHYTNEVEHWNKFAFEDEGDFLAFRIRFGL